MEKNIQTTITTLKEIALSGSSRPLVERQRAIDALTLFRGDSLKALAEIVRRADNAVLRERAELYRKRITEGADLNMNL